MAIIGLCGPKAAAWGTSTAVLTAYGLDLCGYPVEFLQMVSSASDLSFEEEAQLPFAYTPLVWEGMETYKQLLAAMDRARSERRHLVVDAPADPFEVATDFVQGLDVPLIPKDRHTSLIPSPFRRRATNRRRSSITELSFHGINTSSQMAKSVTHVSGTKRHLCLGSLIITRSRFRSDRAPANLTTCGEVFFCVPGRQSVMGPAFCRLAGELLGEMGSQPALLRLGVTRNSLWGSSAEATPAGTCQ